MGVYLCVKFEVSSTILTSFKENEPLKSPPRLWLMACSPSTYQQLLYSDERLSDILEIQKPLITNNGMEINDTVRAFKGDHSASQFEAGQQKWGNYAYHGCCINSNCPKSLHHLFKCNLIHSPYLTESTKFMQVHHHRTGCKTIQ